MSYSPIDKNCHNVYILRGVCYSSYATNLMLVTFIEEEKVVMFALAKVYVYVPAPGKSIVDKPPDPKVI